MIRLAAIELALLRVLDCLKINVKHVSVPSHAITLIHMPT